MSASFVRLPPLAAAALSWALAQSPTPPAQSGVTLRTTTTLVQLSVVAHDSKGRAVTDLKKEDFELFDNGKPQDIAVFTADTAAPAPRAAALKAFPEDVVSPAATPRGNAVILLDYLNSGFIPAAWARVEIVRLLNNFDPTGKVALYVLDDSGTRLIGEFGSDRDALLKKIASVTGQPSRCSDNACIAEKEEKDFFWFDREFKTLGAFDSFADRLSFLAGRKALIWVSTATNVKDELAREGWPRATPFLDAEKERVMEKLNNADVALYPIDSCGLTLGGCRSHPEIMDDFATRTGGVAVHGLNGLDVSIRDAIEDIRFTYSLAFYPPQDRARTDFHQLKVQVKRPGIKLEYKQGYSLDAPATVTAASLMPPIPGAESRALAAGALIAKELETRVASPSAANVAGSILLPYFYTAPNVALVNLAMEIGTADLKFRNVDGKQHAELSLDAVASRPDGGVAGRFSDTVKLDLAAEAEVEAFRKRPYNYEHQFRLASGQYDVRVAFGFGEEGSGKVEIPLVIDGWDGQRLALSGVALAKESRKVAADFTSGLDLASVQGRKPLIARSVEIIPAGSNRFQRAEPCLAFLEIYEPLLSGPHPPKISLQIRVLDRQTGEQKVDSGIFGVDNLIRAGDQVIPVSLTVPIATLSPGSYRLEVKATHSPGTDPVIRLADFEVE